MFKRLIPYLSIVDFQKIVGIRRAELAKLTGDCLVQEPNGEWVVWVKNGKGRKSQLQRLNHPEDIDIIKPYFENKGPDELIFTDKEINNDLNYHRLRALSAQEYYSIHLQRLLADPNYEEVLIAEIEERWNRCNINKETGKPKHLDKTKLKGWYVTRGSVRKKAIENNKSVKYNRLCAMYTSMMKLSHYRLNVCIENYLIR